MPIKGRTIYDYNISFELDGGERIKVEQSGFNIADVISKVRHQYPDAHMFIVLKKRKST